MIYFTNKWAQKGCRFLYHINFESGAWSSKFKCHHRFVFQISIWMVVIGIADDFEFGVWLFSNDKM